MRLQIAAAVPCLLALLALTGCTMNQQAATTAPATAGGSPAPSSAIAISRPLTPVQEAQLKAYDQATQFSSNNQVKITNQMNKAYVLVGALRLADALSVYDRILQEWGDATAVEQRRNIALAWLNKGQLHKGLKQRASEAAAYDELLQRFGKDSDSAIRRTLSSARLYQAESQLEGQKYLEATEILRQVEGGYCAEAGSFNEPVCGKVRNRIGAVLERRGLKEDALAAYEHTIHRHSASTAAMVRQEVTYAYVLKGQILVDLKRRLEAIDAYDGAVNFGTLANTVQSKAWAAMALVNKGASQDATGKPLEALTSYDRLVAQFDINPDAPSVYAVSRGLLNKAYILQKQKRPQDALPLYDGVLRKVERNTSAQFREVTGMAYLGRGRAQMQLQRYDDSIVAFDTVIARLGAANEANLRELASHAASAKAMVYNLKQSRAKVVESITAFDATLRTAEGKPEPARSIETAGILSAKAMLYTAIGMHDEAIAVYDDVIARYGTSGEAKLREAVAGIYYVRAVVLRQQGQTAEAARHMRELIERYKGAREEAILRVVKRAEEWLEQNRQFDTVG